MGGAVIDCGGPVQVDRRICRYVETVGGSAIESVAVLVLDRHQIVLALTEMLRREECESENESAIVDGIIIRIGIIGSCALDIVGQPRQQPAAGGVENPQPSIGVGNAQDYSMAVLLPAVGKFGLFLESTRDQWWVAFRNNQ